MNPAYLLVGLVLLVAVTADLLWTTLWVGGGAGPLTGWLSRGTWRAFGRAADRDVTLSLAGPTILVLTLLVWLGLLWAGWTLVFVSGETSLLATRDYAPALWPDQGYFVAYSMFTMGNGDFTPAGTAWQVAASLTAGSGMMLVTLTITYVLSVLGAVTEARSFASGVTGLGRPVETLVRRAWNADREDFDDLEPELSRLAAQLDTVTEQHLSYPILHYYYSREPRGATPRAVAMLEDVLLVLEAGVPEEHRGNEVLLGTIESSIDSYLEVLETRTQEESVPPPTPNIGALREHDVPTVTDAAFDEAMERHRPRRRRLRAVLEQSEQGWPSDEE